MGDGHCRPPPVRRPLGPNSRALGAIAAFSAFSVQIGVLRPGPEKRADWAAAVLQLVLGGAIASALMPSPVPEWQHCSAPNSTSSSGCIHRPDQPTLAVDPLPKQRLSTPSRTSRCPSPPASRLQRIRLTPVNASRTPLPRAGIPTGASIAPTAGDPPRTLHGMNQAPPELTVLAGGVVSF